MSLQPSRLPEELLHTFVSVVIVVAVGADPCVCPEFFCTARPAHLGARHTNPFFDIFNTRKSSDTRKMNADPSVILERSR
jgi:hypothetical protein